MPYQVVYPSGLPASELFRCPVAAEDWADQEEEEGCDCAVCAPLQIVEAD